VLPEVIEVGVEGICEVHQVVVHFLKLLQVDNVSRTRRKRHIVPLLINGRNLGNSAYNKVKDLANDLQY